MPEPSFTHLADLARRTAPWVAGIDPRPMPGGASTRRFFRVDLGGSIGSAVAMFVPDGATPEEIQKDAGVGRRWPFLEVRDLLADHGIRVPRVLGEATEHGWLLIEDLGDDTIANYLLEHPADKRAVYQTAVRDLAHAQQKLAHLPENSVVRSRAFDEDLLRWEIDHFREWGLEARNIQLSAEDRATFDAAADRIARRIASWPRGFVHRDYQSRNLMVVPATEPPNAASPGASPKGATSMRGAIAIAWIDFQDALLGPRVYDLVALLSDSYQEFDPAFVDERLDEYAALLRLDAQGRAAVRQELDLVTVQRKLKDAGRFIFIDRVKNNPSFLSFVEPTIVKARDALERLRGDDDCDRLRLLLDRVLGG